MKTYIAKTARGALIGLRFFITLLALYWSGPVWADDVKPLPVPGMANEKAVRLGERMYRDGSFPRVNRWRPW